MPIREVLPEGMHEAGWLTSGLLWTRSRRWYVHCNTCGRVSPKSRDKEAVVLASQAHSQYPDMPLHLVLDDCTDVVEAKRDDADAKDMESRIAKVRARYWARRQ